MRAKAYAAIILAVVIWGASIALVKWLIGGEPDQIATYLFLRFLLGYLVINAAYRLTAAGRAEQKEATPVAVPAAVTAGLCLGGGFLLQTSYLAREGTSSIDAAFLTATTVAWIPLVSICIGQKPSLVQLAAVALAIAGTLLISDATFASIPNNGPALIGALLFGLQVVVTAKYLHGKSIRWTRTTLAIPCLLFGILAVGEMGQWASMASMSFLLIILFTGVLSTALAMYLENWSLAVSDSEGEKLLSPVSAGVITALEPFATLAISLMILSEHLSPLHLMGGGLVVAANALEPTWGGLRGRLHQKSSTTELAEPNS